MEKPEQIKVASALLFLRLQKVLEVGHTRFGTLECWQEPRQDKGSKGMEQEGQRSQLKGGPGN